MALNVHRTYSLGVRCSHVGFVALYSSQAAASCTRAGFSVARTYATESALASKRKGGAPSAKTTHKATAVGSAAPHKTPAKVQGRATGHAANPVIAEVSTLPKLKNPPAQAGKSSTAETANERVGRKVTKTASKRPEPTLEEQQLKELEALQYFAKIMSSSDPYGQPIPQSLDVLIPRPALFKPSQYGSMKEWWTQLWNNRLNGAKNAMSLLYLAADDAIPGRRLGRQPWYKAFGWLVKAFTVSSTKETAWLAPFRKEALEEYALLNKSVANRDTKTIKSLTAADYQTEILRRVKKQPSNFYFKWNLEREVSPTQIVSLRTTQYYMAKEDPKFGSRYLVHALVKFDTEQSLECYGPNGEALHEVAEGAVKRPNGTIQAKPKRVTEYLIMEKRLWYDAPWAFREQKWDIARKI